MQVIVQPDPASTTRTAAEFIAARARDRLSVSPRFTLAVSGGHTPRAMLHHLAECDLAWERVHIFQVDERVAPEGDPERNWTHLRESLAARMGQLQGRVYPMPVGHPDLESGAAEYAARLTEVTGQQGCLDLVHLGLGDDGHTASLAPQDPALDVSDRDVTVTLPYRGHTRMTLTFPAINRARHVLWVVVGAGKRRALAQLLNADPSIPASRISDDATIIADAAAVTSGSH